MRNLSKLRPHQLSASFSTSLILTFLTVGLIVFGGCDQAPRQTVEKLAVKVEIQFNREVDDKSFSLECAQGSTVFDVLSQLSEDGEIQLESTGTGERSFVVAIDGVENEKSEGDNWVYRVNGELGKVGSGMQKVAKDDTVTWTFGKYAPELEADSK